MAGIEILAPLRIETRFYRPGPPLGRWLMRLRVYPDEFSMLRAPPAPSPDELDLLDEVLAAPFRNPPVDAETAFLALAERVGPARALWLRRSVLVEVVGGVPRADRSVAQVRDANALPQTEKPAGLPPELGVWLLTAQGFSQAATMTLDRGAIAADLDLAAFQDEALVRQAELPKTWWTSYERARDVGLAKEIVLGPAPPQLAAVIVCGLGDEGPEALIEAHAATSRLAIVRPGTPTNTVEGETTTELGSDPVAWLPLLDADPAAHPASEAVIRLLSGGKAPTLPLLDGDIDPQGHGPTLVRALWPVLWGRAFTDMIGAGERAGALQGWAADNLAPQGPYPAIRVGAQPYGLLPVSSLSDWASESDVEERLRLWAMEWRAQAANTAENVGTVVDASTERLVELFGETAPNRRWGVRPLSTLAVVRAMRAAAGMSTINPTQWEQASASAIAEAGGPLDPLAPFAGVFALPPDPLDRMDKPDILMKLLEDGALVLKEWNEPLGLLGHLVAEAMLLLRARIGLGSKALHAGLPVDPDAPLPFDLSRSELFELIFAGSDTAVDALQASGVATAEMLAERFHDGIKALVELIDRWKQDEDGVFAALLATLDTASYRVDPWVIGLADMRLKRLAADGVPFSIGAYGWVDQPRPFTGGAGSPPAPGPTSAGLLHAPSYAQALTSALLRDAAVRYPGEDRWKITIDSAKVRSAMRLAERVRLGVHPYEALGLEVERLVGDWDHVRILRQAFPLRASHEGQRCCDGARVLRAVLHGAEPLPAGLPTGLNLKLAPLDEVLDTYADLLVADGVHALVSGQGELANAAMEAAAGLGAPPELRAMRTPRQARTVRVSAWALLPPGEEGAAPVGIADPAFAALLDAELGPPADWLWTIGDDAPVSLADRGLHGAEVLDLTADALAVLLRDDPQDERPVASAGGAEKLARANRLADLLGGGDPNPPVPDPDSGRDDAKAATSSLRQAMLDDLSGRFQRLRVAANALSADLDAADASEPAQVAALRQRLIAWRALDPMSDAPLIDGRAVFKARILAADSVSGGVNALKLGIRALAGHSRLPVLPVVADGVLAALAAVPAAADGRPATDVSWLETVAAVRPRLALLEARQLDPVAPPWPAALSTGDGAGDLWTAEGPVVVAYGPGVPDRAGPVAIAGLDAWVDSIPSAEHVTSAAFGFNGPKARAPQAILIGVPPDPSRRMSADELARTVLETRTLARARTARPSAVADSRVATPSGLVMPDLGFLQNWWTP